MFIEHKNCMLNKFVDTFIGATLNILLDQLFEFGPQVDGHWLQFTTP